MPRASKFKPRNVPCPVPNCRKLCVSWKGLSNHLRTHREKLRNTGLRGPLQRNIPNPTPNRVNLADPITPDYDYDDDDNSTHQDIQRDARSPSPPQQAPNTAENSEKVRIHPVINGRPCDETGAFLPDGAPPPPWNDPSPTDYAPYESQEAFELADLLFRRAKLPQDQIDHLMQIWARTLPRDQDPPFAGARDLYDTIDSTEHGDIPWQSFTVSYKAKTNEDCDASWKLKSFMVWFRDPHQILKSQLARRDFADEMDFAPKEVTDPRTGARRYQDFMSGRWAWAQGDILARDSRNHSATFCPIILGSDKTTVSVATGQNEYYPLYISNGLIHNNVRRAHRNGVILIAFLSIPKTDQEHEDSEEFRRFRRQLFHSSIAHILGSLRPSMMKPEVIRYGDGHFRQTIFGLGPYIADYPEQVLLACIVQGWCPKCTAYADNLDGVSGRRTHELTETAMLAFDEKTLWFDYGIVAGIMPFTSYFPHADIHETISPDVLHQLIKGTFKDHLVTWIENYIKQNHPARTAKKILADIDRRIAAAPSFPNLRRFPEGRGYKQWTGDDSKALMKVILPAIVGHVPAKMVRAISSFIEFCYLVRRHVLDDNDLDKLDGYLAEFHEEREIFIEEGIRDDFCLPRQHALMHYRDMIIQFGAPNGLCSSITESRHKDAVKGPYKRSSKFNALQQMITTNQRLSKLSASAINFGACGMLSGSIWAGHVDPPPNPHPTSIADDDDGGGIDDRNIMSEVKLAKEPIRNIPRLVKPLSQLLRLPLLPGLISRFLYEQLNPGLAIPVEEMPLSECPSYTGKVFLYPSAVATYHAPSDISGLGGMFRERIRSVFSWRGGSQPRDCVFITQDEDMPGFWGLLIGQVLAFLKLKHEGISYPAAIVSWFETIGSAPCSLTNMWKVRRDLNARGQRQLKIVHLDTIIRAAHLIGIAGSSFVPYELNYMNALDAFKTYYVNKFIDYHAHEIAF